jgi:L-ascorbate metabolism protein UlaG (beta-lactamase superfamily)
MATLLTYLGHASFSLLTPEGKILYLDAWLRENPFCPEGLKTVVKADALLVTHGHGDHLDSDLSEIATRTGAKVVAPIGVRLAMEEKGFDAFEMLNTGGTVRVAGVDVTMTLAHHFSHVSSAGKGAYPHEPCGYILRAEDMPTIYFAGDTGVFADMKLIGDMYRPEVAILPIGGRFTMGPYEAAWAASLLGSKTLIPMHFGSFPFLTGTVEEFESFLKAPALVRVMRPGETAAL